MSHHSSLIIENLEYHYEQNKVLNKINLEIEHGFISIIGPNGSGKTTLIKLASGLLDPQAGDIHINGISIDKISNLQRARLFTVIQQKQFFPFPFSCLEMVAFGRYPHRKKINGLNEEDYEIIIQAMRATDTLDFKEKMITEVSGGEQQRVVLASALAQQPQILFLDEAFSSMDISYQANLIVFLRRLSQEQGLTVISIVHDLNLAYRYSDQVCILKDGVIEGFGHPHTVMTKESISNVFNVEVELIEGRCFYIDI
jgi:iron complex transport system ATP-binding protein